MATPQLEAAAASQRTPQDVMDARAARSDRVPNERDALLAACQRSEQYLVLAVIDSQGDLRAIAQRDLEMVRAAIAKATGVA